MPELNRWTSLTCPCGSDTFTPLLRLRRQAGGGIVPDPVGQQCAACGTKADLQQMTRQLDRQKRQRELAALEYEVAELEGTPMAPAPAAPAPRSTSGRRPL